MTLKQEQFIAKLPKNNYNMAETMREVGYSDSTTRSGRMYALLRAKVNKAYDPERVKADILKAEKDFAKDKDNSNRARMVELRAKITGLTKEHQVNQVSVFQQYKDELPQVTEPIDTQQDTPQEQGTV